MRKILSGDKKVVLYDSKKQIQEAEIILLKNIPDLPTLTEAEARVKIQDCLDSENLKGISRGQRRACKVP